MIGDFSPGKTVVCRFNTHKLDGTPITLAGTPVVSVYKNSTTESTTGVSLTVDYDSRTGLHSVAVDTSADGTFYAAGNDFDLVITAGTVDSISVVGTKVGTFSLSNRSALRPTTADQTLDVSATGEAGLDFNNIKDATGAHTLTNIRVPIVTLTDTLTTYTGNTLQTGDSYTIVNSGTFGNAAIKGYVDDIGIAGAGLTALGDARLANLDATITSRKADYTQPTGFLAATFPGTVASTTNITAGIITTVTTTTNLTNLPSIPTDWLTAAGLKADAATKIANEVEAQIIDETDSEKVLTAITDKIASVNPSLGALTLAAIASAVRDVLNTSPAANSLGAMVKASSDRMPASGTLPVATDIVSNGAITTSSGSVSRVTLVDTTTTNTDMRGTNSAALASVWTSTLASHLDVIYSKLPTNGIADETLVIAATDSILLALGTPAQASQIPANFTNATFASAGVFSVGALANAPTGGGGGTVDANLISVNGTVFSGSTVPSDRVMFGGTLGDQSAGDVNNVILPSGPSANGVLVGSRIRFTSGAGQYQERTIRLWDGTNKIAGIDSTLATVTQTAGDTFSVLYDHSPDMDASRNVFASASVSSFEPSALAQFFTLDSGKVYADAVAGSVVKEIITNVTTGGNDSFTADDRTTLEAIYGKLNVAGLNVTVSNVVPADGGTVPIKQGNDYKATDGRALTWSSTSTLSLDMATIILVIYNTSNERDGIAINNITCTVTGSSGAWTIRADLTALETASLSVRSHKYELQCTLVNSDLITLTSGTMAVTL